MILFVGVKSLSMLIDLTIYQFILYLHFLDFSIVKDDSESSTGLYRKKTLTGLCTDFPSFFSNEYKTNLFRVFDYRALHIYSTYENFH